MTPGALWAHGCVLWGDCRLKERGRVLGCGLQLLALFSRLVLHRCAPPSQLQATGKPRVLHMTRPAWNPACPSGEPALSPGVCTPHLGPWGQGRPSRHLLSLLHSLLHCLLKGHSNSTKSTSPYPTCSLLLPLYVM